MQQAVQDQAEAATGVQNPKFTVCPRSIRAWVRCAARNDHALPSQSIFLTVLHVPQILAVIAVMVTATDPFECDRPLGAWLIVSALRQALTTACIFAMARYWPDLDTAPAPARIMSSLYQPLSTLGLIWFIFGNLWYINSEEGQCDDGMRKLTLAMVIIQYIVMFLPCLVLLISLPFACFCFPLFMRIIQTLNPPAQATSGVSQEQIMAATRLERWQPGMFDENTCAISMEEYSKGDEVRILPCGHHFSNGAITTWLASHNSCPMCRARVVDDAGQPVPTAGENGGAGVTRVEVAPASSTDTSPAPTATSPQGAPSAREGADQPAPGCAPGARASSPGGYARMQDPEQGRA